MSTSTSKVSAIPKVENAPSTSTNKQSIPQPTSLQSKNSTNSTQIPSHLPLHQSNHQQKSHGIPLPQSQKQQIGPPRYQPPPPPGGILKNLSPQRSGIPTPNFHQSAHPTETNAHLNLKFPQEVPRLTTIYIPDRNPGTLSRIATARTLQQQRQTNNNTQSQPSPHLSTTDDEQSTSSRNHQQEMLKFVRKNDTDSISAHSPNPNNPNSNSNPNVNIPSANNLIRMNATEQNRHFQVSIYFTLRIQSIRFNCYGNFSINIFFLLLVLRHVSIWF